MFIDKLYLPKIRLVSEIDNDELEDLKLDNKVLKIDKYYFIKKIELDEEEHKKELYSFNFLYYSLFLSYKLKKQIMYLFVEKDIKNDMYKMVIGSNKITNETHSIFKGNKEELIKRIILVKNLQQAYSINNIYIYNINLDKTEFQDIFKEIQYKEGNNLFFNFWFLFINPMYEDPITKIAPFVIAIVAYFGVNYYFDNKLQTTNDYYETQNVKTKQSLRKEYKKLELIEKQTNKTIIKLNKSIKIKKTGEIYYAK